MNYRILNETNINKYLINLDEGHLNINNYIINYEIKKLKIFRKFIKKT